jgi:hypothetical protein
MFPKMKSKIAWGDLKVVRRSSGVETSIHGAGSPCLGGAKTAYRSMHTTMSLPRGIRNSASPATAAQLLEPRPPKSRRYILFVVEKGSRLIVGATIPCNTTAACLLSDVVDSFIGRRLSRTIVLLWPHSSSHSATRNFNNFNKSSGHGL